MDKKEPVIFTVIISVILISGCAQDTGPVLSQEEQEIISSLMEKLNSPVSDYSGSYYQSITTSYYGGGSGSTNYLEEKNISIEVANNQVINYTKKHYKDGWPPNGKVNYYEYYNFSREAICKQHIVSSSGCSYSEEPIPPKMGDSKFGCRLKFDGGKKFCICGDEEISIDISEDIQPELPCTETIQTDGLELGDEFNIIYYPSTDESLCYFVTGSPEPSYAIECDNDNIKLIPDIIIPEEELNNAVCRYARYNHLCDCTFDDVSRGTFCRGEIPSNYDLEIKEDIIEYLETIEILSISEDDSVNQHCFTFPSNGLEHKFCFNEQNILTFAEWGKDIREGRSRDVEINKIEKT
jgi:hypothetical protein